MTRRIWRYTQRQVTSIFDSQSPRVHFRLCVRPLTDGIYIRGLRKLAAAFASRGETDSRDGGRVATRFDLEERKVVEIDCGDGDYLRHSSTHADFGGCGFALVCLRSQRLISRNHPDTQLFRSRVIRPTGRPLHSMARRRSVGGSDGVSPGTSRNGRGGINEVACCE